MAEYVITIKRYTPKNDSGAGNGIAPTLSGEPVDGGGGGEEKNGGFSDFVDKVNKIKKFAPVAYALKYADLAIATEINRVELRTGHSTLQEKLNYEYSMAKRIAGAGATILGGILTGNPLVAVAGAMSLVNTGVQIAIAEENIRIAREVEGIGIEQANIRAGSGGGRYGRSMQ